MITQQLTITQLNDSAVKIEIQIKSQSLTSIHQSKDIHASGFEDLISVQCKLPYPATYTPYTGYDNIQCNIKDYKFIGTDGYEKTYESAEEAIKDIANILKCNCGVGGQTPDPEPEPEPEPEPKPDMCKVRIYSPIPHWERPTESWLLKEVEVEKGSKVNLDSHIDLSEYYKDFNPSDLNYEYKPTFKCYGHRWVFEGWYVEHPEVLEVINKDIDVTFRITWTAYNFYPTIPSTMGIVFITEDGLVDYSKGYKCSMQFDVARFMRFGTGNGPYHNVVYTPGEYSTDTETFTISGSLSSPAGCRFFSPGREGDPNMPIILKNIKSDLPFILVLSNAFDDSYGLGEIQFQVKGDPAWYTAGKEGRLPVAIVQNNSDKPYNFYSDYKIGTQTSEIGMLVRYNDSKGDNYIEWEEVQCNYILDEDKLIKTEA